MRDLSAIWIKCPSVPDDVTKIFHDVVVEFRDDRKKFSLRRPITRRNLGRRHIRRRNITRRHGYV